MRTCGAPLNVHVQRLHIINCKKKTPIHLNGSFVFSADAVLKLFEPI